LKADPGRGHVKDIGILGCVSLGNTAKKTLYLDGRAVSHLSKRRGLHMRVQDNSKRVVILGERRFAAAHCGASKKR